MRALVKKEEKGRSIHRHYLKEGIYYTQRKMYNSIKGENKLEGSSNFRYWKKRIDLILEKNKELDLVKGNVKPTEDASDANKVKFRNLELVAMTLMV